MSILKNVQRPWAEYEDNILKESWAKGLTAGQISNAMPWRTRNSILGRVFRLRLESRESPVTAFQSRAKPTKPKPPKVMVERRLNVTMPTMHRQQQLADKAYMLALCREAGKSY